MTRSEGASIRILQSEGEGLRRTFTELGVDPYGIRIMLPKGTVLRISVGPVSFPAATILKQEMLSLGGDCALPRNVVTGAVRRTGCILIGSQAHFSRLAEKLAQQPFGLAAIARQLTETISNYRETEYPFSACGKRFIIGRRPLIMGIINASPDSFSGDGIDPCRGAETLAAAALAMEAHGADIIDIGGESSRPGSKSVPAREELRRIIPAIKLITRKCGLPVSVDTSKPEVARQALDNGAVIVNDITGLRDKAMSRICASRKCGIVIMHMRGTPRTMAGKNRYGSLMGDLLSFFRESIHSALESGIDARQVIIDPGIGFAKDAGQNLEILKNLREFKTIGRPLLVGTSRKSFIGTIIDRPPGERLPGTIATCVMAAANGADILRVHDVTEVAQAVKTACKIINA